MHTRARSRRLADLAEYVTTDEAAEVLDYHVNSVRRLIRRGKLRAEKKGVWLIRRDSLKDFRKKLEGRSKHDPTLGS